MCAHGFAETVVAEVQSAGGDEGLGEDEQGLEEDPGMAGGLKRGLHHWIWGLAGCVELCAGGKEGIGCLL